MPWSIPGSGTNEASGLKRGLGDACDGNGFKGGTGGEGEKTAVEPAGASVRPEPGRHDRLGRAPDLHRRGRLRPVRGAPRPVRDEPGRHLDRKSTRLNSSHVKISYAVCCLKKT